MDWMNELSDEISSELQARRRWSYIKKSQRMYPGRNDLPELLNETWDIIHPADKAEALIEAWSMAEWPLRMVDADFWRMMFDELTGGHGELFLHKPFDEKWELVTLLEQTDTLDEHVRLYRGCVQGHELSMSWTANRPTAEWFAKRFDHLFGRPMVATADIPRQYIYAIIDGARGENEYIVDPAVFEDEMALEVSVAEWKMEEEKSNGT